MMQKRSLLLGLLMCAILAMGLLVASPALSSGRQQAAATSMPGPGSLVKVERRSLEDAIDARGYIGSSREEKLFFPMGGYVKAIDKQAGDTVVAGDAIAETDAWDLESQLARAELDLKVLELRHTQETASTQTDEQIYQLTHDFQSLLVDGLKQRVAQTRLTAPFDGLLYDLSVSLGSRADPYATVATVVDPTNLVVKVLVSNNYRPRLSANMPATITIQGQAGQPIAGHVVTISGSDALAAAPGFADVAIAFDASSPVNVPYRTPCTAHLVLGQGSDVLMLPSNAISWDGFRAFVDLNSNGQHERREIVIGRTADGWSEILSGLSEGDQVFMPGS